LAEQTKEYDLIIVGAGMAGCVLAARVAERGVHPKTGDKLRIALIEAGPYLERTRNSDRRMGWITKCNEAADQH
jgi:flavin-dependent dehydrogenase